MAEMAADALADAQAAPPAADAFPLVEPAETRPAGTRDFGLDPETTDAGALEVVLSALSGAFERARARDAVLAGFAEQDVVTLYLGSSTGVRLSHVQPTGAVSLVGRTADGSGSAWVGEPTIAPSLERMEQEIWRRLDWATTQVALEAGRYEVIMPPSAVSDMMGMLAFDALRWPGRRGRPHRLLPRRRRHTGRRDDHDAAVHALQRPVRAGHRLHALHRHRGERLGGLRLRQRPAERAHRLAARRGVGPTALPPGRRGAVRASPWRPTSTIWSCAAMAARSAGGSVDDMVARTERGLLLTCLWYIREVDPATLLCTGLTRDGVYVVENGAVVGAANNFRFNESPVDLLTRATEVGTPVRSLGRELGEYLNRTIMPPLRIPDFNMSSVSQAS